MNRGQSSNHPPEFCEEALKINIGQKKYKYEILREHRDPPLFPLWSPDRLVAEEPDSESHAACDPTRVAV